jgi:hypothetical protein
MNERSLCRFTGLAVLLAAPLYVAAFLLQGSPPSDRAGGEQVLAYAGDHRTAILAAISLTGLVLALALCVQIGLARILHRAESDGGLLASLGLVGGVGWIVVVLAGLVCTLALAYRPPVGDPQLARSLLDMSVLSFALSAYPTVVNVGAFSLLMLRSPLFPRWVAWLGFLTGAAHLLAGAAFAHDGLFAPSLMANLIAPALYTLWGLATGIVLLRRGTEPTDVVARTTQPVGTLP